MAVNIADPAALHGSAVTDRGGKKLGKVYSVYYDNETDRPEWVAVKSGLFGTHVSFDHRVQPQRRHGGPADLGGRA
jgi:uncharacterized protein YrrD